MNFTSSDTLLPNIVKAQENTLPAIITRFHLSVENVNDIFIIKSKQLINVKVIQMSTGS